MQNWKQFFTDVGHYFIGADRPEEKNDYWHPTRASAVKHFCAPTTHSDTLLQRKIYITEGSKAHRTAEAMQLAIQSSPQHYYIYKLRYDEYAKYNLLKKAAGKKTLTNQLAEDVHDYLLREALSSAYARLHENILKISPLFADELTQSAIKKYLEKKVAWEIKHPDEVYAEPFVAPCTVYARHKKDAAIPMPHFKNTIGKINIFKHPIIATGYAINVLRKLFLDYPARVICWLVNKFTFGSNVLRLFFSFILAGPFVLLNILFFGIAKAFAGDGFRYREDPLYEPLLENENKTKIIGRKKSVRSGNIEHINKKNIPHATQRTSRQK